MNLIKQFKKIRDNYVVHQVENVTLPVFEENRILRRHVIFSGRVQHMGFRRETELLAKRLGLTGWVKNLENGDVEAEFQGTESRIRFLIKFMHSLKRIKIKKMENTPRPLQADEADFKIV